MGATQHHFLGVDWHLRDVLAWFGALVVPTSVYLVSADFVERPAYRQCKAGPQGSRRCSYQIERESRRRRVVFSVQGR